MLEPRNGGRVVDAETRATIELVAVPPTGPAEDPVRIGLLALATDATVERDFARLAAGDGVLVATARLPLRIPHSDAAFLALADEIPAALARLVPDRRLDAVVFACTSASSLIGPARVQAVVDGARPGTPCTNPATAATEALRALGARRLAVLAPYTQQMTGNVVRFLETAGFSFSAISCLGFDTDLGIGSVPAEAYLGLATALRRDGADAIFVSCTAARVLDAIEAIEAATGLPVVTSNQAAFWHALRLSGRFRPVAGYGRLLRSAQRV